MTHDYGSLEGKFHALFDLLRGALTGREVKEVRWFFEAGEYGLALETLCGIIVEEEKQISRPAYQLVRELAEQIQTDRSFWVPLERLIGG